MPRWLVCALILTGLPVTLTAGDANQAAQGDLNANAALKYWQAFAAMPKLDDAQKQLVADVATTPVSPKVKELVDAAAPSLRELHRGAALPQCAWAVSIEDGAHTLLNHAMATRPLGHLALQRARLHFEAGRPAEGLDDVLAALTLARHLSTDGTLIAVLVGYALEHSAAEAVAPYLSAFDAATLKKLAARLDGLPRGGNVAGCMVTEERAGLDWFLGRVKEIKDKQKLLDFIRVTGVEADRAAAFVEKTGGSMEEILRHAGAVRPLYATWVKKLDLPTEQFLKEWEVQVAKMKDNPVFDLLAPALGKCREGEARAHTRRAMLKAAIAIRLDGPGAAKSQIDPYDGKPFQFTPFEGGFELRSKLEMKDKPMVLTVGRRKS